MVKFLRSRFDGRNDRVDGLSTAPSTIEDLSMTLLLILLVAEIV